MPFPIPTHLLEETDALLDFQVYLNAQITSFDLLDAEVRSRGDLDLVDLPTDRQNIDAPSKD